MPNLADNGLHFQACFAFTQIFQSRKFPTKSVEFQRLLDLGSTSMARCPSGQHFLFLRSDMMRPSVLNGQTSSPCLCFMFSLGLLEVRRAIGHFHTNKNPGQVKRKPKQGYKIYGLFKMYLTTVPMHIQPSVSMSLSKATKRTYYRIQLRNKTDVWSLADEA